LTSDKVFCPSIIEQSTVLFAVKFWSSCWCPSC